jgi:hypothetical protein
MGQITTFDLNEFIKNYNTRVYVETGTGEGVSLSYAQSFDFDKLYSVDIDKDLIESAKNKFSANLKISLINDLSKNALEVILQELDPEIPTIFFLDAHFPGADFHKISYEESIRQYKKDAFPLEDEIKIISNKRDLSKDVFVIDDFVLYDYSSEYDSVKHGQVWQYKWLQDELNLPTESKFIFDLFDKTHTLEKDFRHQGYLIIKPKK